MSGAAGDGGAAGALLVDTAATAAVGAFVLAAAYALALRVVPFSIYEAVGKKRNAAVAVVVVSVVIGLGIILSASLKPGS